VEDISLDVFENLGVNDILFIDSSHVVKFQNDVSREFLDILPVIQSGAWVHISGVLHAENQVVDQRIAFNEQYLLDAFLDFNSYFKPTAVLHWLWKGSRNELMQSWAMEVQPARDDAGAAGFGVKST
jgi:hypothetical protein